MNDTIRLGGNIELIGAEFLDNSTMIVLKKIIGNQAREFSQKTSVEKLTLSFLKRDDGILLDSTLTSKGTTYTSQALDKNLFMALDSAMKKLSQDIG